MNPDRAVRIKRLFHEALTQAPGALESFLETSCAGEPDIYFEVKSRLDAYSNAPDSIEQPILALGPLEDLVRQAPALPAGNRIGNYRLLEPIGRGGTGVVYHAERADGLHQRKVAIKLIYGAATVDLLHRFRIEQQALATLDHSYIAKLLDAGRADDGALYFVMEYVGGTRIDRYCDEKHLTIGDRLRVFLKVCEAVSFAHGKLVIHRDIKPGNILVKDDGNPILLDFGIAKILDPDRAAQTTRTYGAAFTPEFASPEQIAGQPVATASDVYSLGALLYVLLSGLPARPALQAPVVDLKFLMEHQPQAPSRLFLAEQHDPLNARGRALQRGATPERVRRALAGDLDNIVAMALRAEPTRRYGSVERLAEDVRNHLDHRPVAARPDAWAYRAVKMARRNRAAVTAVTVGVLGLIATATGTTIGLWKAAQRTRQLELARSDTERARDEADAVTKYLESMISSVKPEERGRDVTVREILDTAADSMSHEFASEPLIEARLRDVVGKSYHSLGSYEAAERNHQAALAIRQHELGPDHPLTLAAATGLANVYNSAGRLGEAAALHREILETKKRVLGDEHPSTLLTMNNLGNVLRSQGEFADAERIHRHTLSIQRRALGPNDPATLLSMHNLALALDEQGRHQQAEPFHRQVLQARRQSLGDEHPDTLISVNNLGYCLRRQGKLNEAERLHLDSLDLQRNILGPEHPDTLFSLGNLAATTLGLGRFAEAEGLCRETLVLRRRVLGPEHPQTLETMNDLGAALYELGRFSEAEALQTETLEAQLRVLGAEHSNVILSRNNLALSRSSLGRYADAEQLHLDNLAIARRALGPEHPRTLLSMKNLATSIMRQGRYGEAEDLYRRTLETRKRVLGVKHVDTLCSMHDLARCCRYRDNLDEAHELYLQTIEGMEKVLGEQHPYVGITRLGLAETLLNEHEPQAAIDQIHAALALYTKSSSVNETSIAVAQSLLGECLVALEQFEEAEPILLDSHATLTSTEGESGEDTVKTIERIVQLYQAWGKQDEMACYVAMIPDRP